MEKIGGTWRNVVTLDKQNRLNILNDLLELAGLKGYTGLLAVCESAIVDAIFLVKPEDIGNNRVYGTLHLDDKGRTVMSCNLFPKHINQFEVFVFEGKLYLVPLEQ